MGGVVRWADPVPMQVQRLEDMLVSSSINLTEEKQVLEQIKQLKVRHVGV